mmetsp:Transcript_32319/g.43006  ORF Transcript_32319/g.43006 Transcript_32319/m.43006 type:complete len:381 (-) Transcript_32319:200-1342(-)
MGNDNENEKEQDTTTSFNTHRCNPNNKHTNGKIHTRMMNPSACRIISENTDNTNTPKTTKDCNITFRPLNPNDRQIIQQLHEAWFPVKYEGKFYDALVYNKLVGSNEPLYSCVATIDCANNDLEMGAGMEEDENAGEERIKYENGLHHMDDTPSTSSSSSVTIELLSNDDTADETTVPNDTETKAINTFNSTNAIPVREEIAGCIVGSFVSYEAICKKANYKNNNNNDSNTIVEETTKILISNPNKHTKMFYIMTLGTVNTYRNCGIGSTLVERCIKEVVERDLECGAVYLHVITYNFAAIQFYERLGFVRVKEIEDYYRINGKNHNCYLYARYFHGNKGHWTVISYLASLVSSVWKQFTNVLAPSSNINRPENSMKEYL